MFKHQTLPMYYIQIKSCLYMYIWLIKLVITDSMTS